MRPEWESPFLDAELTQAGRVAGPRVLAPDFESPFLDAEIGLGEAPPLELDQPAKGRAIPRGKASDPLGKKILDLLWEPIPETDVKWMADRLRRLEAVLDAVSNVDACALLDRLLPKGDLHRDFEYRLSRASRQRLRRKLRQRCQKPPPPPPPPKRVPDPVIGGQPAPVRPTITVQPPTPSQPRTWKPLAKYTYKTTERRLRKFRRWAAYYHFEVEFTGSVNATDQEMVAIAAGWENGKYKPELEVQFKSLLVPDIKVERDGGKLKVSLKKEIPVLGSIVTCTPHVHLSLTEPLSTECTFLKFPVKRSILGHDFQVEVEPKLVVTARVDWKRVIIDTVKPSGCKGRSAVRCILEDLWKDLLDYFGKKILKAFALRLVIASLVGAAVAWLLFSEDDEDIEVEPPDIAGWGPALDYASGGKDPAAAAAALLGRATVHRRAFAKGFGDTLAELTRAEWARRLGELETRTVRDFKDVPGPKSTPAQWMAWSYHAGKQVQVKVDLAGDEWARRFRRSEIALMFAAAAWRRGKLSEKEYDNARQTAEVQASVAGMAAAVQYVRQEIRRNTYEFLNEQGKLERRDGLEAWKGIAQIVRKSGITEADIQRRFGQFGVEQLPVTA
jgi:hypothetical protein